MTEEPPMEKMTRTEGIAPEFTVAMRGYDRMQVDEYLSRLARWTDEARVRTEHAESQLAEAQRINSELRKQASTPRADTGTPAAALGGLGQRIEGALGQALSECDELRQRSRAQADMLMSAAKETAVDIVCRARTSVEELTAAAAEDRQKAAAAMARATEEAKGATAEQRATAQREAEAILDHARTQAANIQAEAEHRRARVLEAAEQHRRAVEDEVQRLVRQRDHVLQQLTGLRSALEGAISVPGEDETGDGPPAAVVAGTGEVTAVDLREVPA
jgi:cell division septum initiation protein DivIVA